MHPPLQRQVALLVLVASIREELDRPLAPHARQVITALLAQVLLLPALLVCTLLLEQLHAQIVLLVPTRLLPDQVRALLVVQVNTSRTLVRHRATPAQLVTIAPPVPLVTYSAQLVSTQVQAPVHAQVVPWVRMQQLPHQALVLLALVVSTKPPLEPLLVRHAQLALTALLDLPVPRPALLATIVLLGLQHTPGVPQDTTAQQAVVVSRDALLDTIVFLL
jgi:hypothetical protein